MGTRVREFLVDIPYLHIFHDDRMHIHDARMFLHVGLASAGTEVSAVFLRLPDKQ